MPAVTTMRLGRFTRDRMVAMSGGPEGAAVMERAVYSPDRLGKPACHCPAVPSPTLLAP